MIREVLCFLRRHWPHLLLAVPGALLVTVLHEAAHAAVAMLQGGTLLEFVWLPGGGHWGYVSYDFPAGVPYSSFVISIAPYVLWLGFAALAMLLSLRRRKYAYWQASILYLWLFVVPLADIANAAFPYLRGQHNDFHSAFGPPSVYDEPLVGLACVMAITIGYWLQRRLYREEGLGLAAYLVLSTVMVVMIGVATGSI
ncbi:MAG TPA: hypothetical protein VGE39_18395 [Prosthecobacter sp.]